jgi:hypothetical protein
MSNDFQTQSNKVFAKAAERAATKGIMIGADIFRAVFNFLKDLLFSFLGK